MTCDSTPIFPHGSREGCFPYMSVSTYFPLQHQCWLKSSHHPACCPGSYSVSWSWNRPTNQTHSWLPLLNTCCWLARPIFTQVGPDFSFISLPGPGLQAWPWGASPPPEIMGIQGMELFAIGVVIIIFMAVLKQFGILEPMSSFEGNGPPEAHQMVDT